VIRFVLEILPAFVVVTARCLRGKGARAIGPVVLIHPKFSARGDLGTLQHELEHVRQWWILALPIAAVLWFVPSASVMGLAIAWWPLGAAVHPALYRCSRRYRLWAEVRAHRIQCSLPDGRLVDSSLSLDAAAERIATKYDLRITQDEAHRLLCS
jgi:hypothetical protein